MKAAKSLLLFLVVATSLLAGCKYFAVAFAPKKQARGSTRTDAALAADAFFWKTLHDGQYENIPDAQAFLTRAYLADPTDSVTAAHIGFLHIWQLSERTRLHPVPPTITDQAVLARKYFQESVSLNRSDPRILGFLGSSMLGEGAIHHDERVVREAYYTLQDSVHAWPEFNYFTVGYTLSSQPAGSPRFREALNDQWRNLDVCVNERVDRHNPDYSKYMSLFTTTGRKRVCWNSWIAPHNFEGFFLNLGDMLVKSGDWQTAKKVYANAKLSPDYAMWKFRAVLEDHIKHAPANVSLFNAPDDPHQPGKNRIMGDSPYACMACHRE
jgi:hypothetical protein